MKTYKDKATDSVVSAMLYTGDNRQEIQEKLGIEFVGHPPDHKVFTILRIDGSVKCQVAPGQYVIKDNDRGFYTCQPDLFERGYEELFKNA